MPQSLSNLYSGRTSDYEGDILKILLIGGTGFIGKHLLKRLYKKHKITIFSRDEYKQHDLLLQYGKKIKLILGDVRNGIPVGDYDLVINTSALKHVWACQENPKEAIQINVMGLTNIIEYCYKTNTRLIHISSDKAVEPINNYGCTKQIGEWMLEKYNNLKPLYMWIRCGNIWGSRGSIIPIIKQLKSYDIFEIADMRAERYFLTVDTLIDNIIYHMKKKTTGLLTIYSKKAKIKDIIKAWNPNIKIVERGLYLHEKLTEKLDIHEEKAEYYTMKELRSMLDDN